MSSTLTMTRTILWDSFETQGHDTMTMMVMAMTTAMMTTAVAAAVIDDMILSEPPCNQLPHCSGVHISTNRTPRILHQRIPPRHIGISCTRGGMLPSPTSAMAELCLVMEMTGWDGAFHVGFVCALLVFRGIAAAYATTMGRLCRLPSLSSKFCITMHSILSALLFWMAMLLIFVY